MKCINYIFLIASVGRASEESGRIQLSYLPFFQSSCVHGSPICRSSNHRASMDLLFAVLPIIVHPWICYLPFFQSSYVHASPMCTSSNYRAPMDLLFAVLPIIVHPWICYLPFFQSSCVHASPMCPSSNYRAPMDFVFAVGLRSSNHRASMDLLCAILPIIVRPRISYVSFFQSSCVHGSPM